MRVVNGAGITLALCAAAALVEGFDNQSMGVAAPRLLPDFGLSASQAGVLFSSATFGLFIGAAIGGRAADHLGRKRALIGSLLLFGFCSLLTSIAPGTGTLLLARLMTGLGLGGAMPNFIALASEAVRPERRLSAVSLVLASLPFGGALAGFMALGDRLGWGWRSIFVVGGSAPIVVALIMIRALPESPAFRGRIVPDGRTAALPRVEGVLKVLFGDGRAATTALLWTGFFFTQLVLLLMLNWLPSLIVGLGFSRSQASLASICFNLSGGLGAALLGRLHAGKYRRHWVLATYGGMAAALVAVASVGSVFALAVLACALAGIFIIGAQLVLFALAPLYYGRASRGTGVGAAVAIGRLGSVVGPLFAATLLASGGGSGLVLIGIVPFVVIGGSAALGLTWRAQTCD
jgi:MFS transporter, AAHS family, 3-hydroxyphenylpropionic acid transporter